MQWWKIHRTDFPKKRDTAYDKYVALNEGDPGYDKWKALYEDAKNEVVGLRNELSQKGKA